MERFVFIAAVTIAILFGIGAVVGGPKFHWGDVDFDGGAAPVVATTAGRLEPQAHQGEDLSLRHLVAIVTITPEDRADYLVEIDSPGGTPMPTVSSSDGRVTVDGQLKGRISQCNEDGSADLRGYDDITYVNLPRVNIRAPRALRISRSGAGRTEIGPTETLTLELSGCGAVTAGDTAGALVLDVAGSGDVQAGAARRLNADVAGSADVVVGAVSEGADVDIAGSGSVTIASLNGELSADGAGSGQVSVGSGAITRANVDLAGSGGVDIAATVQTLNVSIVGSGDVDVASTVGDIEAEIAGSGSVKAQAVTGSVREESFGSGDVIIGGQPSGGRTP
ncbi:MAG: GIN domain-containing protein [Vitreimonas sp.]